MEQHDSIGVCEVCKHDDEDYNTKTKLYKLGGMLRCGDCANEYDGDKTFYKNEYGED
jgi:hypothetical protein